ncbi:MAG: hypothetical protein HYT81_00560 [Gemmatimonadetes bacterium]|nr:hypothetical protein [Gemmatimonadota bacterium]
MIEPARFVVCLETGDYPVSLERWKVYRVLQDPEVERHGQLRVIDESAEDYVYPQAWFAPVQLPADVAQRHGSQPARDH